MSVDILGTNCDRCRSMVQYSFTSTETRRLVRTDSPGRPPQLSRSSWTMCDETCPFTLVTNANVYNQLEWWNVPMKFDNKCQCRKTMSSTRAVLKNLHAGGHVGSRNRKRGWDVKKKKKKKKKKWRRRRRRQEKNCYPNLSFDLVILRDLSWWQMPSMSANCWSDEMGLWGFDDEYNGATPGTQRWKNCTSFGRPLMLGLSSL